MPFESMTAVPSQVMLVSRGEDGAVLEANAGTRETRT
jgi:hypothetical protein